MTPPEDVKPGFSNERWWVRRGQATKGPFSARRIGIFLAEKKLRVTDELSPDGSNYRKVTDWPSFAEAFDASRSERAQRQAELAAVPLKHEIQPDLAPGKLAAERAVRRAAVAESTLAVGVDTGLPPRRTDGRTATMLLTLLLVGLLGALVLAALRLLETQPELADTPSDVAARCTRTPAAGEDLSRCYLSRVNLEGQALPGINLRSAMLVGARIDNADLSSADLAYADLSGASAVGSRLTGARLIGVELVDAILSGADLRDADLRYADLTGADIKDALLEGANFARATWIDGRVCGEDALGGCP